MKSFPALFVALAGFVGSSIAAAATPNIIFVMADDMGWGQTGYRGHPLLKTPNLDAMAANGLRFERFYAGNPVCSPTRACVLTGRTNDRAGVLSHGYALRLQEKTIAQALKAAGYATGHFGKWHLNGFKGPGAPVLADDPRSPAAFGFDEYVSATNFIDMDPYLGRNGVPEKISGDSSEIVVAEALRFIEKQHAAGKPVFTVIWYGTPHSPFRASEADKAPFGELNGASADHHGELVAMDRSIGTLRAKLRELGIADNTMLVFNSDNGGLPEITPNTTGGLRGNKGTVYEGGLRVPGIIEWPVAIKPRITSHPACVVDLFPTVADIVGLPQDVFVRPLDGVSLKPLFAGDTGPRAQPLGFRYGKKAAFIDNQHKLLTNDLSKDVFELYDLDSDPHETKNIATEKPELLANIKQRFLAWNTGVQASFEGRDYAGGKVSPPDPEPVNWFEAASYKPWLAQWSDHWVYKSYFDRAGRTVPKGKGKGKKKSQGNEQ
jgi:arylsulfatase A-like enzyme